MKKELNKEVLIKQVEQLDAAFIKFAVTDIDGVLRGKTISRQKFLKAIKEQIGFCNVIFGWDVNDAVYDNTTLSGWHTGYPDAFATIDLNTQREIPWDNNTPFFLADFNESNNLADACPRTLLKTISKQCEDMGYLTKFSKEYEWFNFSETPGSLQVKEFASPQPITPGMFGYSVLRTSQNQAFHNDIYNLLQEFNVPLEGLHTETGDGVYEAAIDCADVLEAADRAVLFKTGVKEIAYRYNMMASFMAKWNSYLPGCSGHVHQSLWSEDGVTNLFYDSNNANKISELLKYYIAGQLYCLPHILPMCAPTVNSYKRYVKGAWASTTVSWGIENRTTALRVINHSPDVMNLETRIPGADANPYLSMAASLASGLYGIKNKLPLNMLPTVGNEYENQTSQKLAGSLQEATTAMKASNIAKELFGEAFTDHFIKTREWEWQQFTQKVTDWELKRYFEII